MSRLLATAILAAFVILAWGAPEDHPDQLPRAVVAWAAGPMEARVAFERPIGQAAASELVGEAIPFQATHLPNDAAEPSGGQPTPNASGSLRIAATRLNDEGRTLVLLTDPFPWEATYRLSLGGPDGPGRDEGGKGQGLAFDLSGVDASWTSEGRDAPDWSGWWPHLDPKIVRGRTQGSLTHERSLDLLAKPGRLTLRTLVQLTTGKVVLRLESNGTIEDASLNYEPGTISMDGHRAELALESSGEPADLDLTIRHDEAEQPLTLRVSQRGGGGSTDQALLPRHFTLPWAPAPPPKAEPPGELPPALAGGDPENGKRVFFGEESRCSACHQFGGEGGTIGPDLSDLAQRDRAWIYREIAEPSAEIAPNYVTFTVVLHDGRVLSGVVRAEDGQTVRVLDTNAQETRVSRSEIDEMRPSATSIMPVGLAGGLGEEALRDLLAFLTTGAAP